MVDPLFLSLYKLQLIHSSHQEYYNHPHVLFLQTKYQICRFSLAYYSLLFYYY